MISNKIDTKSFKMNGEMLEHRIPNKTVSIFSASSASSSSSSSPFFLRLIILVVINDIYQFNQLLNWAATTSIIHSCHQPEIARREIALIPIAYSYKEEKRAAAADVNSQADDAAAGGGVAGDGRRLLSYYYLTMNNNMIHITEKSKRPSKSPYLGR